MKHLSEMVGALDKELVGVVTLGWGTRPRHTIQRIFPGLETKDYLEIGRMCMTEELLRNSESRMLSQLVKWIRRNIPELKVLFTWADGMLGKVGYVMSQKNADKILIFRFCGIKSLRLQIIVSNLQMEESIL